MINFHPFQISVFYSFCYWFSIKFLKLFLVSVFFFFFGGGGGRAFISRVKVVIVLAVSKDQFL